jgi:two-component system sensor histidine kinase ChvG
MSKIGRPGNPRVRGWTLTWRILAVNILTLILLAVSVLYLDAYRNRLTKERMRQAEQAAEITAHALSQVPIETRPRLLATVSRSNQSRIRIFDPTGKLAADSWTLTGPTYRLRDPDAQRWTKDAARAIDRGFRAIVDAEAVEDVVEPAVERRSARWRAASRSARTARRRT